MALVLLNFTVLSMLSVSFYDWKMFLEDVLYVCVCTEKHTSCRFLEAYIALYCPAFSIPFISPHTTLTIQQARQITHKTV
jgi:hypothetical protein